MSKKMLEQLAEFRNEGSKVFNELYDEQSDVRHFSEARRENSSDGYSAEGIDKAASVMLDPSIDQSEEVYREFSEQPLRK